ncbi:Uncharacterised protein g9837 [Pycnogonum litorale]
MQPLLKNDSDMDEYGSVQDSERSSLFKSSQESAKIVAASSKDDDAVVQHSDRGLYIVVVIVSTATAVLSIAMILQAIYGEPQLKPHGAVSSTSPECSKIALAVMERGGTAVDGAIAAAFCLTVVAPYSASIGGGGIMLVHRQSRDTKTEIIDFVEMAPSDVSDLRSGHPQKTSFVGIPGFARGLKEAREKYGKLPLEELINPAIKLASDGFKMDEMLHEALKLNENSSIVDDYVTKNGGMIKDVGDVVKVKKMAATLQTILQNGLDDVYDGRLSKVIVEGLNNLGSNITRSDMDRYGVETRSPIETTYKANHVLTSPSPSIGPILTLGLEVLRNLDKFGTDSATQISRLVQVLTRIERLEKLIADPRYAQNYTNTDQNIISNERVERILNDIKNVITDLKTDDVIKRQHAVTVSVVDTDDLFVSMSLSLGDLFGSKIELANGIILNDALKRFSSDQQSKNVARSYARPVTTLVPVVVIPAKGLCGSRYSISTSHLTSHLEIIANSAHVKLTKAAKNNLIWIDANTGTINIEDERGTKKNLTDALEALGYRVNGGATGKHYVTIVGKFDDDITEVLTEPAIKGSNLFY